MAEAETDFFGKMAEFLTLGRGVSEIALDAYRKKLYGLTCQCIAQVPKLEGKRKLDLHNNAKRLVLQTIVSGLLDPK